MHTDRHNESIGGYEASIRSGWQIPVPESLSPDKADEERYKYVILGAGCAGLSLCCYLLEQGVEDRILILDGKKDFADDRTWCFWDVEPTPFTHQATKSWNSWIVRVGDNTVVQSTQDHPYLCLTAADFYRRALELIAEHENVTLRLGTVAEDYKEHDGETFVRTARGTYTARYVFDGRGLTLGSPVFEEVQRQAVWVPQKFLGLRLRSSKPVFDPNHCTLMDFSVSQERGLRFVYALPFTEREALVENVYLTEAVISAEEHRAELREYLGTAYGLSPNDYVVDGEERGYIPMTDYAFTRRLGERAYSIGMLGGETRPSTGYTFLRIQRYCKALAESVAAGRTVPAKTSPSRYQLLDKVFLRFMRQHPEKCPNVYLRMFAALPADTLVRFLTEKSILVDDLRLVWVMPKMPFIRIAVRMLISGLRR